MNRRLMVVSCLLVSAATAAGAQDVSPAAGSWGAEASSAPAATLLRFRGTGSAWMAAFSGGYSDEVRVRRTILPTDPPSSGTIVEWNALARIGLRRYGGSRSRTRPFTSLLGLVGFERGAAGRGWNYGAAVELGASHFFSRHASLGTSAELSLTRRELEGGSINQRSSHTTVRFSGLRLTGGVYF